MRVSNSGVSSSHGSSTATLLSLTDFVLRLIDESIPQTKQKQANQFSTKVSFLPAVWTFRPGSFVLSRSLCDRFVHGVSAHRGARVRQLHSSALHGPVTHRHRCPLSSLLPLPADRSPAPPVSLRSASLFVCSSSSLLHPHRHGVVRQAAARQRRAGDPIRILPDGRSLRIAEVRRLTARPPLLAARRCDPDASTLSALGSVHDGALACQDTAPVALLHTHMGATTPRGSLTSPPFVAPRRSRSASAVVSLCCRQFVATAYPQLKSLSPSFPVLIRESKGAQPRITARYGEDTRPAAHRRRPVRSSPAVRLVPRTSLALWSPLTRTVSASALHVFHRFWR